MLPATAQILCATGQAEIPVDVSQRPKGGEIAMSKAKREARKARREAKKAERELRKLKRELRKLRRL